MLCDLLFEGEIALWNEVEIGPPEPTLVDELAIVAPLRSIEGSWDQGSLSLLIVPEEAI